MLWLPAASVAIWQVATPELKVWPPAFEQVMGFAPSLKVIVPVGGPELPPVEATVAVNVTFCVTNDGLREETTVTVVPLCVTVCVKAALVEGSKLPSPL